MKTSKDSSGAIVMGRDKCFSAVAAAVKDVVSNAIVDLKSPEVNGLHYNGALVHT